MLIPRTVQFALGAAVTLAMFAGCSSGGSQINSAPLGQVAGASGQSTARLLSQGDAIDNTVLPSGTALVSRAPIMTASFMNEDASSKPLIFVSDVADGVVNIYPQGGKSQKQVGQITGLKEPQGIATDAQGNLYVANTNASNILVFAPPYTKGPSFTIPDAGEYPADVAISSAGVVAVTNICNAPHCVVDSGNVTFYAKGSTKRCATVSDETNFSRPTFAGFDKTGNLYIDAVEAPIQNDGLIAGGCKAQSIQFITGPYTVGFPGSVQVDKAGRIAITDPVRDQIETFDPPVNGNLGNPVTVTPLNGLNSAISSALLASGKSAYVADTQSAAAYEFAYTPGGAPKNTIAVGGQPVGVAVTPAEQP
jgi:hypothetical protein